jgi:hypothetical protein
LEIRELLVRAEPLKLGEAQKVEMPLVCLLGHAVLFADKGLGQSPQLLADTRVAYIESKRVNDLNA